MIRAAVHMNWVLSGVEVILTPRIPSADRIASDRRRQHVIGPEARNVLSPYNLEYTRTVSENS